jgi:hypothetical protein
MTVADDQALAKAVVEEMTNTKVDVEVIAAKLGGDLQKSAVSMR